MGLSCTFRYEKHLAVSLFFFFLKNSKFLINFLLSRDPDVEWVVTRFGQTPPMPTYAFGFAIYHSEPDTGLEKITFDEKLVVHADTRLFNQTLLLLPFINQTAMSYQIYFNSSLSPDQFDFLAVPFPMDVVIENWGLLVANQDQIIQVPIISAPHTFQGAMQLISHQIGLNWLEGVVNVEEWDYIWLTRGLNKLFEYYIPSRHPILGQIISWNHFSVAVMQQAFIIDEKPGAKPMEMELRWPEEINARFDDVISVKSAAVLSTMRNAVSKEAFDEAVKKMIEER